MLNHRHPIQKLQVERTHNVLCADLLSQYLEGCPASKNVSCEMLSVHKQSSVNLRKLNLNIDTSKS